MELFAKETRIGKHRWYGVHWVRWSDALEEAGLSANSLTNKVDSHELLRRLATETLRAGKLPTQAEMKMIRARDASFPHAEIFARHFGKRDGVIEALRSFCAANAQFGEVLTFLPQGQPETVVTTDRRDGYVYLLKSGKHYKIGRSDTVEQRIKQITVALPETVQLYHVIATDDPSGIEAYWHRRFADKRVNGEWFLLSRDDVAAFRRRKTFQ